MLKKHPGSEDLANTICPPRSTKEGKLFPCPLVKCRCGFNQHRDLLRHYRTRHEDAYLTNPMTPVHSLVFVDYS